VPAYPLEPQWLRGPVSPRCAGLGLTGRIRIAAEGINGTVGGTEAACDAYEAATATLPFLAGVESGMNPIVTLKQTATSDYDRKPGIKRFSCTAK
jgi:predicted sulfurtransferase